MSRFLASDFDAEVDAEDVISQFRQRIVALGLTPPDNIIADGNLHRFASNGQRGDDSGWYVLHLDNLPAGRIGDFRTGVDETWCANIDRRLTPAEQAARQARSADMRDKRAREEKARHAEAAVKAVTLWESAIPVADGHPYLIRKQIAAVPALREIVADEATAILGYAPKSRGEQLTGRLLVAPVKIGDAISTCELIDGAGRKSAVFGGAKVAGYWAAQLLPHDDGPGVTLLIGEGVATVLSAQEATGAPAVAALSSGNLTPVARAMRVRYPTAQLIILGDLGNGLEKAEQAAQVAGGRLVVPVFGTAPSDAASDFNDMLVECGREAVRHAILGVLEHRDEPEQSTTCAMVPADVENDHIEDGDSDNCNDAVAEVGVTAVTGVHPSADEDDAVTASTRDDVTAVTVRGVVSVPENERPCFRVFDDSTAVEGISGRVRPGVWLFTMTKGTKSDPPAPAQQWVCSPLHVDAVTFDAQVNNFGRLLRFMNTLGNWRIWSMPMELLRAAGDELRGELLSMGVQIDPVAHRLLAQYLQSGTPTRRVQCALQVGWCGSVFVLPNEVIGPDAGDVIFQTGERDNNEYAQAGTLAGWQAGVAVLAVGNPLLLLALSAGFAGPLLGKCQVEGGGLHFVGESSTGKTTLLEAACSIWGGSNFRRSWRTTANGLEGAAALFNDGLLALDEISECNPQEIGAIVYALGNGRGKQRASRSGAARSVARWRCFIISSGERSIGTAMAEGGHRTKAGQSVRLLDLPVACQYGAFDELHGLASAAALSDAVKRTAATHFGHAGRAFLQRLTHDTRDFSAQLERIKALPEFVAEGGEGQDKRAAARLALLALAGELAIEYGIVPWEEGAALQAAADGLQRWRAGRGRGNDERRQILDQLSAFIERHGDSRFSDAGATADTMRVNRAGWWREEPDGRVYLFNSDGMREALQGHDFKRALDTLQAAGVLIATGAERAKPHRIGGRLVRAYVIHADRLEARRGA